MERVGDALWIEWGAEGLLIDAPTGTAAALLDRRNQVCSVLLTSGRLDRVSGLVGVLASLGRGETPLVVRFPVTDERGALLVEAWQRGWAHYPVTLDAIGPGADLAVGRGMVHTEALSDEGEPPPLGVRLVFGDTTIGVLPRCRLDGAAARIASGCDLLVVELGGSLSAGQAARLAGAAELWLVGQPQLGAT